MTATNEIPGRGGSVASVAAPVLPATEERKGLTKKEIAADHPTWCPGCGDFSVLALYFKLIEKQRIESKIIKPKLAYIIANWIEKKDAAAVRSGNSQYKFNLLYRSSKDGLHSDSFRFKCKNHGPCFILIKPKSNNSFSKSNGF